MAGGSLPEKVGQSYYTYGLFISSYPISVITIAASIVLLCCYPLLNVPLPGNVPTVLTLPVISKNPVDKILSEKSNITEPDLDDFDGSEYNVSSIINETEKLPYVWIKDKPLLYVQQIIMKTGVTPWGNLKLSDAFRAPLNEVFKILEIIRNHVDPDTGSALSNHCFHIENVKRKEHKDSSDRILPEYSCLLLSPANLWQQNHQTFTLDSQLLQTIFNYQNLQKGKVSTAEMAFGMQLKDAGIKRYPLRARARALQYAVTIFYQEPQQQYLQSLIKTLKEAYPLHQNSPKSHANEVTVIYYPGKFKFNELVPLTISFFGVFVYIYFSLRKIEAVKSKVGLATCSTITIAGSLSMSMGLCFFFGFTLSLQGKEIFPYLVILVGLENVLVLTKSVTSTDTRLDVKIRLAQGLSREGWSITKNLLLEITILTVSLFTFVPVIQEFSIFMVLSLISDFILQMLFFATVLGMDVKRMEYFREQNSQLQLNDYFSSYKVTNWKYDLVNHKADSTVQRMTKSKSHPRLNGMTNGHQSDVLSATKKTSPSKSDRRLPKRIRLVNIWARTRLFQRAFMVWMIVWISMIVYNSGLIDNFVDQPITENAEKTEQFENVERLAMEPSLEFTTFVNQSPIRNNNKHYLPTFVNEPPTGKSVDSNETISLKHSPLLRPWKRLSKHHWSSILNLYNVSVYSKYIVILPPVLLSHKIDPREAYALRNPEERDPPPLRWQALAAALDPIEIMPEYDSSESSSGHSAQWGDPYTSELPIYPTTPMEILLLAVLCTISVLVIAYTMVVLYRCVCSRNYAEWRTSWDEKDQNVGSNTRQPAIQLVMEALPVVVGAHTQEVECLATDGERIASCCLQGTVKLWDAHTCDLLHTIDRHSYFQNQKEMYDKICLNNLETDAGPGEMQRVEISASKNQIKSLSSYLTNVKSFKTVEQPYGYQLTAKDKAKYDFAKVYRTIYMKSNESMENAPQPDETSSVETAESTVPPSSINNNRPDSDKVEFFDSGQEVTDDCEHENKTKNNLNFKDKSAESDTECVSDEDGITECSMLVWEGKPVTVSPIWCMDMMEDLIILGCADGRLEFWEACSGQLMCVWSGGGASGGLTSVRALGPQRAVAAAFSGHLHLVRVHRPRPRAPEPLPDASRATHRRNHVRSGSASLLESWSIVRQEEEQDADRRDSSASEDMHCVRVAFSRAHQQPITELHAEGGRVLTGGQDHVLKVHSAGDLSQLLTLHGHYGPITSCFVDRATPTIAGSGSQDGTLCVWDLHSGACLYSLQAHDGAVTSLSYTASYVISAGSDERLCVWDRFQGHMLNSVHIGLNYMSRMLPLTGSLLLMGDRNGLTVYDLSTGDVIRSVILGQNDGCIFVRQIAPLKDAIVCDYANQLRVVRFPLVSKFSDSSKMD